MKNNNSSLKLNKENIEDVYPMNDIQRGMIYTTLRNPGSAVYHDQFVFYVPLIKDSNRFKKALELMVDIHPILRTSFDLESYNEQIQILHRQIDPILEFEDLTSYKEQEQQEEYIKEFMLAERFKPYDFSKAPLWRIKLFNVNSKSTVYLIQFHHAILDGWSMASFNTQLFNIYSRLETEPVYIPEKLSFTVKDAVIEEVVEKKNPTTIKFWKDRLIGHNKLNIFSKKETFESYRVFINAEITKKLKQHSIDHELRYRDMIFGAFVYVLKLISFQDDFVLGMVSNTRPPIEDSDRLLGCFLNTLPMRLSLKEFENLTWLEFFRAMDNEMKVLKTKDRSTLYDITKIVGKERSIENPFFDIIYNYIDFYNVYKDLKVSDSDSKHFKSRKSKLKSFEVTNTYLDINIIDIYSRSIELHLKLTREFEFEYSLADICDYVENILTQYLENPNAKVKDTSLLSVKELRQIKEFNITEAVYTEDTTVLGLMATHVKEEGKAPAVSFEGTTMIYRDLDEQSNQLANYLVKNYKIEKNDLVGVRLDRSQDMLISILGVLKSGGAYIPIDTQYPEERVLYIEQDSNYKVCIDASFIASFRAAQSGLSKGGLDLNLKGSDVAYGIYTSGSTGNPKGVLNTHAGLYNRLLWMRDDLGVDRSDVILQKTPYTFDVSVWELLMPSITGCELVFAKPEGHKDPLYLQQIIEDSRITITHFVPSMLGIFLENLTPETCRSLRHVVCSGEALPSSMVEEFKQKLPWVRIHNLYGPTEAGIDVTSIDLTDVDTKEKGVSIGKPVANTKIYIVDKNLLEQPIGVPGELLIEGIQVAQGYLNRPDLNSDKFITSPFTKGARIYRTGDLARWLPNGEIAYIGRIDDQVKIRGNRIELGEIESKMQSSGYVDNAVVMVRGESSRKYLVGYVIAKEEYTEDALYDYLTTHLPDYMVPSQILILEELPLTSSGKVDRKVLLAMEDDHVVSDQYVAARNEMEEGLVRIWEEVLEYEGVGVRSNFFRIGGDSILSIRLISKINNKYDTSLTIAQLYESNTIEGLCDEIQLVNGDDLSKIKAQKKKIENDIHQLKESVLQKIDDPENIEDVYPMRDIQKGMVLASLLNPSAGTYHDQFVFNVPKLNITIFKEILSKLVKKHSALRTSFNIGDFNSEVQIVLKEVDFDITRIDIQDLDISGQKDFVNRFMESERVKSFDFDTAPLWNMNLFTVSENNEVLLFQFHHAILDGWSQASLYTELFKGYEQYILGEKESIEIKPLKSSNKQAVVEEIFGNNNSINKEFWNKELNGLNKISLFKTKPVYEQYKKEYDKIFRDQLTSKCKNDDLALKSVIYGTLYYIIHLLSNQDNFIMGSVDNNRPLIEDGEKLLGCFLNTLPVKSEIDVSDTWGEYFKKIDHKFNYIKKNDRLTLNEIKKTISKDSSDTSPIFNILFNYLDFHVRKELDAKFQTNGKEDGYLQKLGIKSFESTNTFLDMDVNMSGNDGFTLNYTLQRELKNNFTLERINELIENILQNYLNNSESKIKDTDIVLTKEKDLIESGFNKPSEGQFENTIIDLFEETVQNYKLKTAIIDEDASFTYEQLSSEVNRFAHFLNVKYKLRHSDVIGLELQNSDYAIVSIMAILKLGGTYVPIDIDFSLHRKEYILNDCNCKFVINDAIISEFIKERLDYNSEFDKEKIDYNDAAYIIYTSGSTGKPKGVPITHESLVDYSLTFKNYIQITDKDIILQHASLSFDASVEEIFPTLISGAKMIINKNKNDFSEILNICKKEEVSILSTSPFLVQYLNENFIEETYNLRAVISGGDVLQPNYMDKVWDKIDIYNSYGPTESTVCATFYKVDKLSTNIPIGKPINNRQVYILSPSSDKLMPIGFIGEICIGGLGLTKGYLNREEETRKKIIDNPFESDTKLYRTGDLGRYLADGNIEFLGRSDLQVNVRGIRIELEEIEVSILNTGYVKNVGVLVDGEGENKRIIAFVVPNANYNKEALKETLLAYLPKYMIPSIFVEKDMLQLTFNGKVDRDSLKDFKVENSQNSAKTFPRNELEIRLSSIWQSVLGIPEIGVLDNFFEIGGNSILVMKFKHSLEKEFDVSINIVDLFNYTTIEDQAKLFEQEKLAENEIIEELKF
ncbi:amino acid adenylation domain-containing protein [Aquimarina sp. W85]|uniref:amino acid adenylation domain-containing protein n=1 Tax=Aquimarina rhodophyticola TaxID=3342246 RepID=UPI00366F0D56